MLLLLINKLFHSHTLCYFAHYGKGNVARIFRSMLSACSSLTFLLLEPV